MNTGTTSDLLSSESQLQMQRLVVVTEEASDMKLSKTIKDQKQVDGTHHKTLSSYRRQHCGGVFVLE